MDSVFRGLYISLLWTYIRYIVILSAQQLQECLAGAWVILIEQHLRHVTVLMLQLCVLKICEMVECGLCIYVCTDFCEMLLLPLNMESVLVGLNPSGQFYDTVCIVQLEQK